jgi:signal transduction histidine kinase/CHASE3 domain sensor protein
MRQHTPSGLTARMLVASVALGAVLITVLVFLLVALDAQSKADDDVRHTEQAIAAAVELKGTLLDLETGMRGYVITRQAPFLGPWRSARKALPAAAAKLELLVRDEPEQLVRAREIASGVRSYLTDYSEPIVREVSSSPGRARSVIATGIGRRRVDRLRGRFGEFTQVENRLAADRRRHSRASADRAETIAEVGLVGSVLLVALYFLYLVRSIVRPVRRVAGAARGLATGDLTARVVARDTSGGETAELGRVFNTMAASLEESRDRLQTQNAELEDQRGELVGAVERLAAEKARVERFLRFGRRIAGETEREALCETMLEELTELAAADYGAVYALDTLPGEVLTRAAVTGIDPSLTPATLGDEDAGGAPQHAATEQRVIRRGSESVRTSPDGREVADEVHVPLLQADRTIGVISLVRAGDSPFAPGAVEAVEDLAGQSAVTLASAVALRSARERATVIRAVLDATPDAIALLDGDGNTIVDNPPTQEVRAALVESVRQPSGGYRTEPVGEPSDSGETRDEITLLGSGRTFARYAAPVLDSSGAFIGQLVVVRDVTGERQAERMKDEFFALVSHELRTPLTSIVGYLELVLDDDVGALHPEHRRHLGVVERNAGRLLRLVGDLLFVAQVEAGKLSLDPGLVDLGQLVRESVEAARPRAEEASIVLAADVDPVPTCPGDADRIGQVLDNLIVNALKFTDEEGRVTVTLRIRGASAVLEVTDTGLGIPAAEQEHLFDRFFRATSATARAIPGVGLGLTIVKAIVEAHDGQVSVQSEEGTGTSFRVELPLGPWAPRGAEEHAGQDAPASPDGSPASSSSPRGRNR